MKTAAGGNVMEILSRKLMLKSTKEELGIRYNILFNYGRLKVRSFCIDTSEDACRDVIENFCSKFGYVLKNGMPEYGSFNDNDIFVTSNEPKNAVEIEDPNELRKFLEIVYKRDKEHKRKFEMYKSKLYQVRQEFIECCKEQGIKVFSEDSYVQDNDLTFSFRFLGGYDAWEDGSPDICDSCSINKDIYLKIESIVNKLSKQQKVKLDWEVGEKAYVYIFLVME